MLTFLVEPCQADNSWKDILRIWCWIKQLLRMALLQIKFQPLWRNRRCLCQSLLWLGGFHPALGITGWWTDFFFYAIVMLTFLVEPCQADNMLRCSIEFLTMTRPRQHSDGMRYLGDIRTECPFLAVWSTIKATKRTLKKKRVFNVLIELEMLNQAATQDGASADQAPAAVENQKVSLPHRLFGGLGGVHYVGI